MKKSNGRIRTALFFGAAVFLLFGITAGGLLLSEEAMVTDFSRKELAPGFPYLFGTDWLGRDMLARTLTGLSMSIRLGLLAAGISSLIALGLGIASATMGRAVDSVITWIIDLVMGIPHILLLILISYAAGKGLKGVIIGVSLTHWTSLARLIRGEVLQLKEASYIKVAKKLGMRPLDIARKHMLPHLFPQFLVGLVLLFPHAILHEASITFLGFGLSPEQPAVGVILSESMKYLATGKWWLAVFPGLLLVLTVMLFDMAGESLRKLLDPGSVHD
ncbi:MAG: ABC transporter permease [Lachnospiraceae bacterium]|nr:ABC transporter permease [Lachnospiraceae bacterium]